VSVAVFTDNDFGKVNGVTTTWRAVLAGADARRRIRIYTAADVGSVLPDYFAMASIGVGLPFYREMRIYAPRLRAFGRELRADDIRVIHLATPGPIGLAGRWLAARAGVPVVGSYHTELGPYVETLSGSRRCGAMVDAYVRWFYRGCHSLLVPSQATARQLEHRGYRASQLRLWSRGVDVSLFTPGRRSGALRRQWRVDDRRPAILYTGRLSAEKGLGLLGDVQTYLHRRAVAHQFVFVGDGPMRRQLEARFPEAVFAGHLRQDDVATAMASADLFLFPSATDTFGNVVLEAQASGLPALVSDRGGPSQQIEAGMTGEVCAAGNPDAFASVAARLLRDRSERNRMGEAARSLALTRPWAHALLPLHAAWDDAEHAADRGHLTRPSLITAPPMGRHS
jgi:glycosyltransferase involved in cell wall biosynthesis